ncbi:MAG: hypothetical protein M0Q88_00265 [Bacilli bacterium]|nr:hypothetical protein [Bacilli bacterium]
MKAILMSIQAKHLVNILNGKKTKEIRKSIPKGFVGWVYLYCTKGIKDILYKYKDKYYTQHYLTFTDCVEVLNSKVVARFWFDEYDGYDDIIYIENEYVWCHGKTLSNGLIDSFYLNKLQLSYEQMLDYGKGKDLYAWHIKNLEIFDYPKELRHFFSSCDGCDKKNTIRCTEEISYCKSKTLTRAPQSWQYVEVKE